MPELRAGHRERGQGCGETSQQSSGSCSCRGLGKGLATAQGRPHLPQPAQGLVQGQQGRASRQVPPLHGPRCLPPAPACPSPWASSCRRCPVPLPAPQPGSPRWVWAGLPWTPRGLEAAPAPRISLQVGSCGRDMAGAGQGAQSCLGAGTSTAAALLLLCRVRGVPRASRPWGSALALLGVPVPPARGWGDIPPCFPLPPAAGEGRGWVAVHSQPQGSAAQRLRSARIWLRSPGWAQLHASSSWGLAGARAQPVAPAAAASNGGGLLEPPQPCLALGKRCARLRRAGHGSMVRFGWGVLRVSLWADGVWGAERGAHGAPSAPT